LLPFSLTFHFDGWQNDDEVNCIAIEGVAIASHLPPPSMPYRRHDQQFQLAVRFFIECQSGKRIFLAAFLTKKKKMKRRKKILK